MARVALIGGAPGPVRDARQLGVDVVLVHEEGKYDPDFVDICERIVHAPLADAAAVRSVLVPLHAERPFDRITSATEDCGVLAGQLAEWLRVPGTSSATARSVKDKALTRQVLDDHGLSPVRHRRVTEASGAVEFLAELGEPVIIKPVSAVASIQVHLVQTPAEAAAAVDAILGAGHPAALAEEYLVGPVVSLDSFSYRGRHVPTNICQYRLNEHFVEWEYRTPAPLATPWLPQLRELAAQILDAVGLTDGPSHSEFVLTELGPRLLESHDRFCGLGVPELVRRAYPVDPFRMYLAVPLGLEDLPAAAPEPFGGAVIRFFLPPPGRVARIDGIEKLPGKVLRIAPAQAQREPAPLVHELRDAEIGVVLPADGHLVRPLLSGKDLRNGYVIASGRDVDEAVARCEDVVQTIEFRME